MFQDLLMRALAEGKLPTENIHLIWKLWFSYPVEINNFHLLMYQRHMEFLARNPELIPIFVGKINDELI